MGRGEGSCLDCLCGYLFRKSLPNFPVKATSFLFIISQLEVPFIGPDPLEF